MFTYCGNSPVSMYDPSGAFALAAKYDDLAPATFDQYTGGGCIPVTAEIVISVAVVGTISDSDAKAIADVKTAEEDSKRIYSVYFLHAIDGDSSTIVYVGRVKTANKAARMAYHRTQGREESYSIDGLTYKECRAIEQGGMLYHHTINRDKKINNQIRGVSPTNPNRDAYFKAAKTFASSGQYPNTSWLPASYWENVAENEWLNGLL